MSQQLADLGANIARNSQFSDPHSNRFCMRTRLEIDDSKCTAAAITSAIKPVSKNLGAAVFVRPENQLRKALIMVSQYDHCLVDLLYRKQTKELPIEIPIVVSNHTTTADVVRSAGVRFEHVPTENKPAAESRLIEMIKSYNIDFVILARYMQILSPELCEEMRAKIINIHHSFLPGFKGARPYQQAWRRGVKTIGATAHYVTSDLDEGPIIAQDTEPVTHRDTAQAMMIKGRDIERRVLAAAVKAHAEERIFLLEAKGSAKTVVFE